MTLKKKILVQKYFQFFKFTPTREMETIHKFWGIFLKLEIRQKHFWLVWWLPDFRFTKSISELFEENNAKLNIVFLFSFKNNSFNLNWLINSIQNINNNKTARRELQEPRNQVENFSFLGIFFCFHGGRPCQMTRGPHNWCLSNHGF